MVHAQNAIKESRLAIANGFVFETSPLLYWLLLAMLLLVVTPIAIIRSAFTKNDDDFEFDYID